MVGQSISRRACVRGGLVGAIVVAAGIAPVRAQTEAIQSQDTNIGGLVADITQCKRKDGVLTLKVRVRNTSDKKVNIYFTDGLRAYDNYYLTAGDKKYFVLRDTEDKPLATNENGDGYTNINIEKDGSYTWWAKYPAPPADVTSVTFYTSFAPPFEDLPITD
jgi:hypothetical protein